MEVKRIRRQGREDSANIPHYMRREAGRGSMRDRNMVCEMPAAMGADVGVVRPQRGGGVDHLAKVQQNKAQTDTLFLFPIFLSFYLMSGVFLCGFPVRSVFPSPGAIGTLFMDVNPLIF